MNYWSTAFGLAPAAWRDFGSILRRLWWYIIVAVVLCAGFYTFIGTAIGGVVGVAAAATFAAIVSLVGSILIFGFVMRIRWPDYVLDGEQFGQLIPLALGMGILMVALSVPQTILDREGLSTLGLIVEGVLMALLVTKFAFLFYASEEPQDTFGDPFGISWRATSGPAFLPTLAIVVLSMLPTWVLIVLGAAFQFDPIPSELIGVVTPFLVMAFFSPWKIRWMGALLGSAKAELPEPRAQDGPLPMPD